LVCNEDNFSVNSSPKAFLDGVLERDGMRGRGMGRYEGEDDEVDDLCSTKELEGWVFYQTG
jgi:hypothetical protein